MSNIYKSSRDNKKTISTAVVVVLAILVIFFVWTVIDSLADTQDRENLTSTKQAIMKSAIQCYALEGQYPAGLEYLEDNYGLTLDRKKYVYHYESVGANMIPTVNVYPLN